MEYVLADCTPTFQSERSGVRVVWSSWEFSHSERAACSECVMLTFDDMTCFGVGGLHEGERPTEVREWDCSGHVAVEDESVQNL